MGGDDVRWWELAGHETAPLTEAWRRLHYACRSVAEIGGAFGDPPDGTLRWFDGSQLLDGFFAGRAVGTTQRVLPALRLWDMHLFVITESGAAIGELPLEGHTVEQATGWIVDSVLNILDEPVRQATEPAQGLPDHALGDGAEFGPPNQFPQAELIRVYANTGAMLGAAGLDSAVDPGTMMMSAESGGARLGLAPPGEWSTHGCWFVSGTGARKLSAGRWVRDGLAVFDLVELHGVEDGVEQRRRVACFLSEAFNGMAEQDNG